MRKILVVILINLIWFSFSSCKEGELPAKDISETESNYISAATTEEPTLITTVKTATSTTEITETETKTEYYYSYPKSPVIFDFAELPENMYPCGDVTINELAAKYGEPQPAATCLRYEAIPFLLVYFPEMRVHFYVSKTTELSFSVLGNTLKDCELSEDDKNVEISVNYFQLDGKGIEFLRGITIGKSTKDEVIALYPPDAYYSWVDEKNDIDMIEYFYAYRDEDGELPDSKYYSGGDAGNIAYNFDENNVLESIRVQWHNPLW